MSFINNSPIYNVDSDRYKEDNDCLVRAMATAFNTSYDKAHAHMKKIGRPPKKGIDTSVFIETFPKSLVNTKYKVGPYSRKNKITIARFCKEHPVGRYFIVLKGHAIAIVDGVVYDYKHAPRRQVIWAIRIHLGE